MRLLVDTHTLIWAVDNTSRLSTAATKTLQDPANELLMSAATVWEIAIKYGQGKLPLTMPYRDWMQRVIADLSLRLLPITIDYADAQAGLPRHHGDPFDRLLVAQCQVEQIPLVSADVIFDRYGVTRVW
ncbi:MAG: type II toxin-antitoxin system VapC family toxin [Gemmataceae bacterium]